MARLAQVAPLGRLAWWTLSLPSLLSLGRLGREVAYISDLSKQSPHVRCCEGFRMTAHRDGSACTGAVVRKPPVKERAGDEAPTVTRGLWGFDRGAGGGRKARERAGEVKAGAGGS